MIETLNVCIMSPEGKVPSPKPQRHFRIKFDADRAWSTSSTASMPGLSRRSGEGCRPCCRANTSGMRHPCRIEPLRLAKVLVLQSKALLHEALAAVAPRAGSLEQVYVDLEERYRAEMGALRPSCIDALKSANSRRQGKSCTMRRPSSGSTSWSGSAKTTLYLSGRKSVVEEPSNLARTLFGISMCRRGYSGY